MKPKEKKPDETVKVSEKGLLSLVSGKLKNKVLFPEKLAEAKEYVKKVTIVRP